MKMALIIALLAIFWTWMFSDIDISGQCRFAITKRYRHCYSALAKVENEPVE